MAINWSDWDSLGKPESTSIGNPFVQRNQDGRLEVFAVGAGTLFNVWQLFPNAGWNSSWAEKGRPSPTIGIRVHQVGRNADGRQEVFALGEDNALWQIWQVAPNDGWRHWKSLGTPTNTIKATEQFTVGRNQDGRQEIFAVGSDGNIWQIWQIVPNGGWSAWKQLGQPSPKIRTSDRISVGRNLDGRQELFVMGGDDAVWQIWQVFPNGGWSDWKSLGKPPQTKISHPRVRENADGHLEVFASGGGVFCNIWQEAPNNGWRREGWNEKKKFSPDVELRWLEVALNRESRLEVLALGSDGALWHSWQQAPAWSAWHSLGNPLAGIRPADKLTLGRNQDGRLEAFVMGQDGGVWHIWQIV